MRTVNPYLNFNGNTEDAFNFYKSVFGGEIIRLQRFNELQGGPPLSVEDGQKIMHISLSISETTTLMGSDILESFGQKFISGNNFYISLDAESKAEADRIFNSLSAGGSIEMPMQDTFWGAYYGSFADKFGVQWMITFETSIKK